MNRFAFSFQIVFFRDRYQLLPEMPVRKHTLLIQPKLSFEESFRRRHSKEKVSDCTRSVLPMPGCVGIPVGQSCFLSLHRQSIKHKSSPMSTDAFPIRLDRTDFRSMHSVDWRSGSSDNLSRELRESSSNYIELTLLYAFRFFTAFRRIVERSEK